MLFNWALPGFSFEFAGLLSLIFMVAFLYASVGHGGASGYLAVLSLAASGFSWPEMVSTALILNILVAGLSFYAYFKNGHFSWRLTWPFMLTSIPAAFLGGMMKIPPHAYAMLLALTLLFAAFRLAWTSTTVPAASSMESTIPLNASLPVGAGIGLVSGMVGVGGGIFLSPVMLLMEWADVRRTSATAALFIVVNALSGLLGRMVSQHFVVGHLWPFMIVAAFGGGLGAYFGANRFSSLTLRRLLAFVLLIAAVKLLTVY